MGLCFRKSKSVNDCLYSRINNPLTNSHNDKLLLKAIKKHKIKLAKRLLKNGADINYSVDNNGETPLYFSCLQNNLEMACLCLYYGADVSITSNKGGHVINVALFSAWLLKSEQKIAETLINYLVDNNKLTMSFSSLLIASDCNFFTDLIEVTSDIKNEPFLERFLIKNEQYLNYFKILKLNPQTFRDLMQKFPQIINETFVFNKNYTYNFHEIFTSNKPETVLINIIENIYYIVEADSYREIVLNSQYPIRASDFAETFYFYKSSLNLDKYTEFVCVLLSYGIINTVYDDDLKRIYFLHGYCDLFKVLLHMNTKLIRDPLKDNIWPNIIYDMSLTMDDYLIGNSRSYLYGYNEVIKFFRNRKLKEIGLRYHKEIIDDTFDLPSLIELARNVVRQYIIKTLKVTKCCQFYSIVNRLPIAEDHIKIITLEKEIY